MSRYCFRKKQCAWHWQNVILRIDFKKKECSKSDFNSLLQLPWLFHDIGTLALPSKNVSQIKSLRRRYRRRICGGPWPSPGDTNKEEECAGPRASHCQHEKEEECAAGEVQAAKCAVDQVHPTRGTTKEECTRSSTCDLEEHATDQCGVSYLTHPKSFSDRWCSLLIYTQIIKSHF